MAWVRKIKLVFLVAGLMELCQAAFSMGVGLAILNILSPAVPSILIADHQGQRARQKIAPATITGLANG